MDEELRDENGRLVGKVRDRRWLVVKKGKRESVIDLRSRVEPQEKDRADLQPRHS